MMRWLLAAAVILGACGDDTTILRVRLETRPAVLSADTLRVTVTGGGDTRMRDIDIDGKSFPLSFTVTPTSYRGQLRVSAQALRQGNPVAAAAGQAHAIEGEQSELTLTIEPFDFVVNEGVAEAQELTFSSAAAGRQLAAMPDGRFLVVWENDCPLNRCDILGRLYGPDGRVLVNETTFTTADFLVNQTDAFSAEPSVAASEDGFVVAWASATGALNDVVATFLDPDAGHLGSDVFVASTDDDERMVHAQKNEAGWLFAWTHREGMTGPLALAAQRYAPDATSVGAPLDVSAAPATASMQWPHGAELDDGFVLVWEHREAGQTHANLRARLFDQDGTAATQFDTQLTSYPAGTSSLWPQAVPVPGGGFLVTWRKETGEGASIALATFASDGTPASAEIPLATINSQGAHPAASARASDGAVLVVWHDQPEGSDDPDIHGRLVHPTGLPVGPAFVVNTTTTGAQEDPSVAALTDEAFAVAWTDKSMQPPDTQEAAIRARIVYPALSPASGVAGALCGSADHAPCAAGLSCADVPDAGKRCLTTCDEADGTPCSTGGLCRAGLCRHTLP